MTVSDVRTDLGAEEVVERTPWPAAILGLLARYPLGAAGALVVLRMVFAAVFAEVDAPYAPDGKACW